MPDDRPDAVPPDVSLREAVEQLFGTKVTDLALYEQALTHRSLQRGIADVRLESNERLEFLGDAVLGMIVAEVLYRRFPEKNEGYLTRLRAKLVSGKALARAARGVGLGPHLRMSDNMAAAGGRDNPALLADAFEALVAALYLDQGLEPARDFVHHALLAPLDLAKLARRQENYKSLLLEYMQARGRPQPTYRTIKVEGPSHDRTFTAEVLLDGEPHGSGTAGSKKGAEQRAARQALRQLREETEG